MDTLAYSSLINVQRTPEMELLLKGISKNNRRNSLVSPSLWFSSQFTGEPINDEGMVDPAPEGIEMRRTLQDPETPTTDPTTQTETPPAQEPAVVTPPIHETSTFSVIFTKSSNDQFRQAGYVDAMIPNLSFSIITVFVGGIWYFASSVFCAGKITVRSNCLMRFLVYGGERCIWISLMLSTLELTIFSVNNLMSPDFSNTPNIVSFASAMLAFVFVVTFPIIIFRIANQSYDILWSPDYYNRYAFFFCEFKLDTKVKTSP